MPSPVAPLPDAFAILDAVPMGICVLDEHFVISFWNRRLEEWTGIEAGSARGQPLAKIVPELARAPHAARIRSALTRGSDAVFSAQIHRALLPPCEEGSPLRRHHCIVRPYGPTGPAGHRHAVLIVEDVTEQMRLLDSYRKMRDQALDELRSREVAEANARQQARRLADSNRALELFAGAAAHDLSAPLRRVQNLAELLELGDSVTEDSRRDLGHLRDSVTRMGALVNDLYTYSRSITEAEIRVGVDLAQEIADVVADLESDVAAANAVVELDPTLSELPRVQGNPIQLRRVFQNLLDNALKYRRHDAPPHVVITGTLDASKACCCINVDDDGVGIEPEHLEAVFEPFRRMTRHAEVPGSGLGLALCAKICERHGGRVYAQPRRSGGTRLCVELPLGAAKAA